MRLPIAGIVSDRSVPEVADELGGFRLALTTLGFTNTLPIRRWRAARPELPYRLGIAHEGSGRYGEGMQALKDAPFAMGLP